MNLHSKEISTDRHSKEIVWRVIFNQSSFKRNSMEGHI